MDKTADLKYSEVEVWITLYPYIKLEHIFTAFCTHALNSAQHRLDCYTNTTIPIYSYLCVPSYSLFPNICIELRNGI